MRAFLCPRHDCRARTWWLKGFTYSSEGPTYCVKVCNSGIEVVALKRAQHPCLAFGDSLPSGGSAVVCIHKTSLTFFVLSDFWYFVCYSVGMTKDIIGFTGKYEWLLRLADGYTPSPERTHLSSQLVAIGMRQYIEDKAWASLDLRRALLSTGTARLVHANDEGDTFWGVDSGTGEGQNVLGEAIMVARREVASVESFAYFIDDAPELGKLAQELNGLMSVSVHNVGDDIVPVVIWTHAGRRYSVEFLVGDVTEHAAYPVGRELDKSIKNASNITQQTDEFRLPKAASYPDRPAGAVQVSPQPQVPEKE